MNIVHRTLKHKRLQMKIDKYGDKWRKAYDAQNKKELVQMVNEYNLKSRKSSNLILEKCDDEKSQGLWMNK
jgi:hypothetical protein